MKKWEKRYVELETVVGEYLAYKLTGISNGHIAKRKLQIGQDAINRINFLLKIICCLRGAYNNEGIGRWFYRRRGELRNKPPYFILHEDCWHPNEEGPQKILQLAKGVNSEAT
ncbi:hypothetical protein KJ885_04575 [Patescibacteria group bacterium]|nr:hypothetical protein [Patescibacteria group bacterium]